jgi:hypothetical protein
VCVFELRHTRSICRLRTSRTRRCHKTQSVSAYKAVQNSTHMHLDTVRRNIDQLRRHPPKAAAAHPWQFKRPARECPRDTKCPARGAPSSANFATHQHTTLSECAQPRTRMGLWHRTQQPRNDYDARTWGHKRVAGYQPHTHTCISRRAHQGTRQPHGRHAPASAQTTRRTTKRHCVPCAQHATVSQMLSHRASTDAQSGKVIHTHRPGMGKSRALH